MTTKKHTPRNPDFFPGGQFYPAEAKKLESHWNGQRKGSESYISETLYKSPSGHYFLAGEGGSETKYNTILNKHMILKGVIPLTHEEAKAWAEKRVALNVLLERSPEGGHRDAFPDVEPHHSERVA